MKKRLLFLMPLMSLSLGLDAQLPVSTSVENKNVVLEEFTGMYCTWCPDGHRRANELAAANPGDVVLINIHTGGFASPNPGDPDYRTPWGSAIAAQTNLSGYPAGTVNRHEFPGLQQNGSGTAMSRGEWATAANQILGQTSYVNVALEGNVDVSTNTLTVDVEMYFSQSGAPSSVNLNVALLQDNILGPQIDGANSNPSQWVGSEYNHQHMLRHMLTGQWGDVISSTSMGNTITKQYTYSIPAEINGVPVSIPDLEIVAFVAEGRQEIITGASGPININVPPGVSVADLEITGSNNPSQSDYCTYDLTPEVTVKNNASVAVDSFSVGYSLNGGTTTSQWVASSLAAGASTTVTFPQITVGPGEDVVSYEVSVNDVYRFVDLSMGNNTFDAEAYYSLRRAPFATFRMESFEGGARNDFSVANMLAVNPNGVDAYVVDKTVTTGFPYELAVTGTKSFRWRLNSIPAGESSMLMFEKFDFSQGTDYELLFHYAYTQVNVSNDDAMEVLVSDDCGATWQTVWNDQGITMRTAPINSQSYFYPQPSEWTQETVDLSAFDGQPEVVVAFKVTSDRGNSLYIDDVEVLGTGTFAMPSMDVEEVGKLNLFPNPASGSTTVEFELDEDTPVEITISDIAGKPVKKIAGENYGSGQSRTTLDLSGLQPGAYTVNVKTDRGAMSRKLIISE